MPPENDDNPVTTEGAVSETTTILKLSIERFRGIESLDRNPAPGLNVILGGGDVGKTTILDAIALVLNPSNTFVLSEADYWQRKVDAEFVIQAVIALPPCLRNEPAAKIRLALAVGRYGRGASGLRRRRASRGSYCRSAGLPAASPGLSRTGNQLEDCPAE